MTQYKRNLGTVQGKDGEGLDFTWDGIVLGIKKNSDQEYIQHDIGETAVGSILSQSFKFILTEEEAAQYNVEIGTIIFIEE